MKRALLFALQMILWVNLIGIVVCFVRFLITGDITWFADFLLGMAIFTLIYSLAVAFLCWGSACALFQSTLRKWGIREIGYGAWL